MEELKKIGRPLNKELQLTTRQEIELLNKVIAEKNEAIASFKKYDEERKDYYKSVIEDNNRLRAENKALNAKFRMFEQVVNHETPDLSLLDKKKILSLYKRWSALRSQALVYQTRLQKGSADLSRLSQMIDTILNLSLSDELDDIERLTNKIEKTHTLIEEIKAQLSTSTEEEQL